MSFLKGKKQIFPPMDLKKVLALFAILVVVGTASAQTLNATQTNADIDAGFDIIENLFTNLNTILPTFMSTFLNYSIYIAMIGAILAIFGIPAVLVGLMYVVFKKVKISG